MKIFEVPVLISINTEGLLKYQQITIRVAAESEAEASRKVHTHTKVEVTRSRGIIKQIM